MENWIAYSKVNELICVSTGTGLFIFVRL